MTLKEFIANENWAVYRIDVPKMKFFGDTAFGPMWKEIPDTLEITEEEKGLVIGRLFAVDEWLKQ